MEDQVLAQLLLEYGFVTEEQLEEAFRELKKASEKRSLSQILIANEVISVRALKTIHAAAQRRKESQDQQEALRRRFETRKLKTRQLINSEQDVKEEKKEPELISFGKTSSRGIVPQDKREFKPVTLVSLKDDIERLSKEVAELKEDVWFLKGSFKHEMMGELLKYIHEEIKKLGH